MKIRPPEQTVKSFDDLHGLRAVGYIRDSTLDQQDGYPKTQAALLAVLKGYASGKHSFRTLAQELNSQGYRTSDGRPFTESSISTILNNRFYRGVVVYHRGQSDEEVIPGAHEVPEEIKDLWEQCQDIRRDKNAPGRTSPPSRRQHIYPLSGVLTCDGCGMPRHGIGLTQNGSVSLRMTHSRHRCDVRPQSVSAPHWEHPGVTQNQRRDLAREVFDEIRLRDGKLVSFKPRPEYAPLFAYSIRQEDRYIGDKRSSSLTRILKTEGSESRNR